MPMVFITIFIISFSLTLGTTKWMYTAEVLNDKEMGIAIYCHWVTNFLINCLPKIAALLDKSHSIEESIYVHTVIFFFLYSGVCLSGFFFTIVFVKKSKKAMKNNTRLSH